MITCEEIIEKHLESRAEHFLWFMNGISSDDDDIREEAIEGFGNYGLCVDFVEPFTFDDQDEGYLRYQLSWGGPSDELRFYDNRVEYWFLDWFDGASRDVSHLEWVKWLRDDFAELFYDCPIFA
tara:strand:- start:420 stop:791 length:372 start_codon:yes stop_codon:yes gene_type:complete